jgi:hypothetical protein
LWIDPKADGARRSFPTPIAEAGRARLPGSVLRAETAAVAALVLALRSIDTADPVGGQ